MSKDNIELQQLFANLPSNPGMYPQRLDFQERVVHFCRMTLASYAQSAFLDERMARVDGYVYKLKLDDLLRGRVAVGNLQAGLHCIFHTAHSGSTLLARALDLLEGSFVLKEPTLLLQASSLKRLPQFAEWEHSGDWHRFFLMVTGLLSRTFRESDTALIKTTSVCHNLMPDLLGGVRRSRGLFLYSSLEKYLTSLYKRGYVDHYLEAQFSQALNDLAMLGVIDSEDAERLPRQRKVALLWLSIVMNYIDYTGRHPSAEIVSLDCRRFFTEPRSILRVLAEYFGFSTDRSDIDEVINGELFRVDAKSTKARWDINIAREENKQARAAYGREIDDALEWAESVTRDSSLLYSMPGSLPA